MRVFDLPFFLGRRDDCSSVCRINGHGMPVVLVSERLYHIENRTDRIVKLCERFLKPIS